MKLSKIDVAERQLKEAILLFFEEREPVAIHTLIGASHQIFHDLNNKNKIVGILKDTSLIRDERKKEYFTALNAAKNFFKHADNDPEDVFKFNPDLNAFFIFDTIYLHENISGNKLFEGKIFMSWFILKYPQLFYNCEQKQQAQSLLSTGFDPDDFEIVRMALKQTTI